MSQLQTPVQPGADQTEALGISVREAARRLSTTDRSVFRMLAAGRLKARKCGRKTIITADSIRSYWDSLPEATYSAK